MSNTLDLFTQCVGRQQSAASDEMSHSQIKNIKYWLGFPLL